MNRATLLLLAFGLALAVVLAFPSAHAQTWGKPDTMFLAAIPVIIGLGTGAVYWAIISARRSRR